MRPTGSIRARLRPLLRAGSARDRALPTRRAYRAEPRRARRRSRSRVLHPGLEADEHFAPYAGFVQVAEGRVSEDGETIAIESGGCPPCRWSRSVESMKRPPALALLAALVLPACGTNHPEIPPELLQAGGCDTGSYPAGPCTERARDRRTEFLFRGRSRSERRARRRGRSSASKRSRSATSTILPAAVTRLILVNSAAIWCSACQVEHQALLEHASELGGEGLVILSALFQDAKRDPATTDDLLAWIETFEPNFPMVLDPDYQLGAYASAETAPLNLVIDARNMQILQKFIGDQASVLWPYLEKRARSAPLIRAVPALGALTLASLLAQPARALETDVGGEPATLDVTLATSAIRAFDNRRFPPESSSVARERRLRRPLRSAQPASDARRAAARATPRSRLVLHVARIRR